MISQHHCRPCGCHTDWRPLTACESSRTRSGIGKVGVNARLLDGFAVTEDGPTFDGSPIEVRFIENVG
jgi:hypothetical protein